MGKNIKINNNWLKMPVEIYRLNVFICINQSRKEVEDFGEKSGIQTWRFDNEWTMKFNNAYNMSSGFVLLFGEGESNRNLLLWLKNRPSHIGYDGVLYHELYHVVEWIANAVDPSSRLCDEDGHSEARAYLFQYLVNKAHDFFWSNEK